MSDPSAAVDVFSGVPDRTATLLMYEPGVIVNRDGLGKVLRYGVKVALKADDAP